MKRGEPVGGRLLYPIYFDNRMALPAGTPVHGEVVSLQPDRSRRTHRRLRGDLTPFYIPVVQFDQLVLADGKIAPILSGTATDGVPLLRLSPPPGKKKGSFVRRQIDAAEQRMRETAALFTAPGRGDRLVQFIYTQLPYHPQRIETGTTWTIELAQPLKLSLSDIPAEPVVAKKVETAASTGRPADGEGVWHLRAYLQRTVSSAKEKPGNTFQAFVAEPVFNSDRELVVPEGSMLEGEITQTKPARSFGRQGKLRFKFRALKLPGGFSQPVDGTLAGIDADKSANLQIDSEGGVQQKPQNRVVVPLALTLLASRAFDDDGSQAAHSAVASNGFGIVGRIVGIAASSHNVAAGIGIYGAALSFYDLWLAHGKDVVFVKNTRIEVSTTTGRNPLSASAPSH